ncbi:germinal center-associated signaling and motility protein isoform X1 [Prionailurus viverrinus]|uniref:germinal center-associated signaling and motility protein isoform X1 n=1 Tax=Prionailurus viverrinus TaxID=61388 RepID=UPI001FF0FBBA|nr:germinal center-associated signaling and motility protein isoform X1 [Prionailurus viverrinus]
MGNSMLRKNRCWDCYIAEGCLCLPWKKTHGFEAKPDSDKENTEMSSAPIQQDNADQSSLEDLSYTLINHSVLGRRSSGISGAYYENISPNTKRPREFLRRTETSYALLHVPSSPRHLPSPEDEYELLTPGKISFHSLRQPHPPMLPSEIRVSCLK